MEIKDIKSQYDEMLALFYKNKKKMIESLTKSINLYQNCKIPNNKRVKNRIYLYNGIIKCAKQ